MSRKENANGTSMFGAARALGQIDDSLIAEGEIEGLAVGKTESGWTRVTRSGWFAAAVCALFAVGAVAGMVALGRGGAAGPGAAGTPGDSGTVREIVNDSETQAETETPTRPPADEIADARGRLPLKVEVIGCDSRSKLCKTVAEAKRAILDAAAEGRGLVMNGQYPGGSVLADFTYTDSAAYDQIAREFGRFLVSNYQREKSQTYVASLSIPLDEMSEVLAEDLCLRAASGNAFSSVIVTVVMDAWQADPGSQVRGVFLLGSDIVGVDEPLSLRVCTDTGSFRLGEDADTELSVPVGFLTIPADLTFLCGDVVGATAPAVRSWACAQRAAMEADPARTLVRVYLTAGNGGTRFSISHVDVDPAARTVTVFVHRETLPGDAFTEAIECFLLLAPVTLPAGENVSDWTVVVY